jgi:hypothetical protein
MKLAAEVAAGAMVQRELRVELVGAGAQALMVDREEMDLVPVARVSGQSVQMGQHLQLGRIHLDHLVVVVVVATGPISLAKAAQHGEVPVDLAVEGEEQTTS